MKVEMVAIEKLEPAAWNANRVNAKLMAKIRKSIETFGFLENLVVRPFPGKDGSYEVLSGNHRLKLLQALEVKKAPVVVLQLDDTKAKLLAQTLNRTRGRDDPEAYRQLVSSLLDVMSPEEISAFLPESPRTLKEARVDAPAPIQIDPIYGVIVDCRDEQDQVGLLEQLLAEGRDCRALLG